MSRQSRVSVTAMITYDTRVLLVLLALGLIAFRVSRVRFRDFSFVLALILVFFLMNHVAIFLFSPLEGVRIDLEPDERITVTADSVFSGYRLNPDATAAALDFCGASRTLRTHDRGRWTDGRLQMLGRLDDVVITGGINVDLGRAQRAADAAFGPGAVVLLGVPDERWGTVIAALTELPLTVDDCRARLAGRLEPSAIPRRLRRVAGLPRTSTGKIDRRSLRRLWAEGS